MEENPEDENSPIECAEIDARDKKCDNISENKEELSNHIKQTHGIKCDDCWGQTKKESDMKEHMELFHQKVCLNCDRYHGEFQEIYGPSCNEDIREKYSESQLKIGKKCTFKYCDTIAANDKDLKTHEKLKHSKCKVCLMYFKGKTELETHTRIAHHFKCQECGKVCPTSQELVKHQILIDDWRQCGLCHKDLMPNYPSSIGLEYIDEHREIHRDPDGYFTCATCEIRFADFPQIAKHSFLHKTPAIMKGINRENPRVLQEAIDMSKIYNEKVSNKINRESNIKTNERSSAPKKIKGRSSPIMKSSPTDNIVPTNYVGN